MPTKKAICQNPRCGRPYVKNRGIQKYCSERCRIQVQNSRIHRGQICHWCGKRFKVNFETKSRCYCFKEACIRREWFYRLLKRYKRCTDEDCDNILIRTRFPQLHTQNYCPFCNVMKKSVREAYVKWIRSLQKHVDALLPKRNVQYKQHKQYVLNYDINNLRFQTFYPHKERND